MISEKYLYEFEEKEKLKKKLEMEIASVIDGKICQTPFAKAVRIFGNAIKMITLLD